MTDAIRIIGMKFNSRHGVNPEEYTLRQPFEVDIVIERDLDEASRSDMLEDTVDYGAVSRVAKTVVEGDHCRLIEHVAGRILDGLAGFITDATVTVKVRKPRAPLSMAFDTVEVELHREFGV